MIVEFFMNIIFKIVENALSILPAFDWNVKSSFFQGFLDILRLACYMLPMNSIVTMIGIVIFLNLFRITVSIIKTIWELLPLV